MRTAILLTAVIWHTVHTFTCTSQGFFSNTDDSTCQSYIYCIKLTSGIYISKVYNCTAGQLYNPDLKNCDQNYVCSSVTEITTQNSRATESTTQSYTVTALTTQTSTVTESTTLTSTTSAQNDSTCVAQGRFPNNEDSTCSTYYFCYYLTSGQFLKQNYSCTQGSRFDPTSQSCSTDYECGTNATSADLLTTRSSSFNCTAQGRFSVDTDVTCTSYYFCYYLSNGQYVIYNYTCPSNYRFDPTLQICSTTYQCVAYDTTTIVSSTLISSTSTSSVCVRQGRIPVEDDATCSSYYFCYYLPSGQYVKYNYTCPSGTLFDPISETCSSTYQCGTTISSSTDSSTSAIANTDCVSQGRFSYPDDTTCTSYYFCYYLTNGLYQKYNYTCPTGSKFDPNLQICSTTYNCSTITTKSLLSSLNLNFTTSSSLKCLQPGRYPVEEDITCLSYYYCIRLADSSFIYEEYTCPSGSRFDPFLQFCNETFQCESSSITETREISSSSTSLKLFESGMDQNEVFICVTAGKFPNLSDMFCRNYYFCFPFPNGNFGQQLYSCADGEKFDPNLTECNQDYQCPISTTTEITMNSHFECTTEGKFEAEQDPTCQTYHYCFSLPNQEFRHQLYSCASGQFDPTQQNCSLSYQCLRSTTTELITSLYFECSTVGKFSAKEDSTCQTYYYCFSLSNGQFGKHIYSCAAGKKFDPDLQTCNRDYQCSSSTN